MWITGWIAALATNPTAAQTPAPAQKPTEREVVLAHVPDGLEVALDFTPRNERGAGELRPAIEWSSDGLVVAYSAQRADGSSPVVNARVGPVFAGVSRPKIVGSRAFFHVGRTLTESTEAHWIWVDGTLIGPEDGISNFAVRPDGKQVAYWTEPDAKVGNQVQSSTSKRVLALATEGKSGKWTVVRGETWWLGSVGDPTYSVDGESVVTCACERFKGRFVLRASGKRQKPISDRFPEIESLASSSSGAALAVVSSLASNGGGPFPSVADKTELWFKDRRVGAAHAVVSGAAVDARGGHVAYVVTQGERRTVAVDDEAAPLGSFDFVLSIVFDPTGERVAFIANRGGKLDEATPGVVLGGAWFVGMRSTKGGAAPTELGPFLAARDLSWSADGQGLAFGASQPDDGWRIVRGEQLSDAFDDVGAPHFSADGKTIGFGVRVGRDLGWRELTAP